MRAIACGLRSAFGERAAITCAPRIIERTHALNHALCDLYNLLLRERPGWMGPYAAALARVRPDEREGLYRLLIRPRLLRLIQRAAPDVVVSVHPMANHHLARALAETYGRAAPPLVTVVTDPVGGLWPAWICSASALVTTATSAAAREARAIAQAHGLGDDFGNRVRTLGMPVGQRFFEPPARSRGELLDGLELDPLGPVLLVSAGWAGEGTAGFLRTLGAIRAAAPRVQVVAVCGRSRSLLEATTRRFWADRSVAVLGETDEMSELMAASDAIFTKPGGLTTFEAIARGLPILVHALRPLMPQEAPTAEWLVQEGIGRIVREAADLPEALALVLDPDARLRAHAALLPHRRPDAALEIARAAGLLVGCASSS